jgi:predicted DNA-binding protein (UPF0251 family)
MQARESDECCTFGKVFDSSHDEKFATLKVRDAQSYYDALSSERRITRHLIEMHRICLGLRVVKPEPSPDAPVKLSTAELVEELPKAIPEQEKTLEERKEEIVQTYSRVEEMTPAQLEEEQRIQLIMSTVLLGLWDTRQVRKCKHAWGISERTIYRLMEKARERLADGRGSVMFGKEVSTAKTISIREAAIGKEDWKGAIAAQKHLDQITGVLSPPSVQINQQINIATHPIFRQTLDRIFTEIADELDDHPDLLERVYQRLSNCLAMTRTASPGDGALVVNALDVQ